MENMDMSKLMNLLKGVNSQDLESALRQANQIMQSKDKDKIIDELKNKLK